MWRVFDKLFHGTKQSSVCVSLKHRHSANFNHKRLNNAHGLHMTVSMKCGRTATAKESMTNSYDAMRLSWEFLRLPHERFERHMQQLYGCLVIFMNCMNTLRLIEIIFLISILCIHTKSNSYDKSQEAFKIGLETWIFHVWNNLHI